MSVIRADLSSDDFRVEKSELELCFAKPLTCASIADSGPVSFIELGPRPFIRPNRPILSRPN
jgi:hypothetical protein